MLKPSDILHGKHQRNLEQQIEIERHIDSQLRFVTQWPCVLDRTRANWSAQNIAAVLQMYRDAGWTVTTDCDGMAKFNP